MSRLRDHVVTFGVMDELAMDRALVYKSTKTQEFFPRLGIRHRVWSTYNLHSKQPPEGAVKADKRMLRDNMGAQGTLNTNKFLAALLAHRKKPDAKITMSSKKVIVGRRIKDVITIKSAQLKVGSRWVEQREAVMARRHHSIQHPMHSMAQQYLDR